LQLAGIAAMLVPGTPQPENALATAARESQPEKPATAQPGVQRWESNGVVFESHDLPGASTLSWRLHGQPEKFSSGQLSPADSTRLRFDADVFGVGLGAFGSGPDDASGRFGEFLALAGAAVTQPTDGSSVPDFQLAEGQF